MPLKKVNVYLVNHTHWDREWYFSHRDSLILSDLLFTNMIKELEKHPEASFTLDGQISILDDYVAIHPETKARIKHLVSKNQLQIGPWYTQPDALHVQGESLLRNGMIAILSSRKYGKTMSVGYLPDTFGFNSQLPVILDELGLKSFVFWRGIDIKKTGSCYFIWHSLGNSRKVIAVNMPQGYSTGMLLNASNQYVNQRLDPAVTFIEDQSNRFEPNILIPTGNDQMSIITNFSDQVAKINEIGKYHYQISNYEDFIEKISHETSLSDYMGEFLDPVLARVHRTCGSSRMDIKLAATALEDKLVHQVEPLMVIGRKFAINLGNCILTDVWKKLLDSQAHDSLAGSVVDSVAEDILHRLKEGNELADGILNTIKRLISLRLKLSSNQVVVFNPLPRNTVDYCSVRIVSPTESVAFDGVDDSVLVANKRIHGRDHLLQQTRSGDQQTNEPGYFISDYLVKMALPAMGYKILNFRADSELELETTPIKQLQTEHFTVVFDSGHVDLKLNDGTVIHDFICLKDSGNAGDTYDYSPPEHDRAVTMLFRSASVFKRGHYEEMKLAGQFKLPRTLSDRRNGESNTEYRFTMTISYIADLLQIHVSVDNQIFDHKLVLAINTGSVTDKNTASVPFGYLTRSQQSVKDWQKHFVEKPVSIWPLDNNVTVENKKYSITIFSKMIKEYQQHGKYLLFTLLASTDQLGKADLINRPGRASGDTTKVGHPYIPTPGAEVLGKHNYDVQIYFAKTFNELVVAKIQEKINFQAMSYQIQSKNLFLNRLDNKLQDDLVPIAGLPTQFNLIDLPNGLFVSACYPSYFGNNATILRLFNPSKLAVAFKLPSGAQAVNALEDSREYHGIIAAYDLLSIKIQF
ncbi:conserved protein of unknown function [Oenococcus oeni]|uniref:Glycoside hydrolase family 38 central domain-containing protein n=1 Tax=Oenococcus oeni TaxID=1247 RepID=A0AAQ2UTQ3_OENOE|nr:glycoside hydrolase family 38 C-terminal domain-containing protein [Oenococcus oeni]SYW03794.1 conserved hypothetical protein [Oenococcus oeni]VDB98814.1 conserved protein of unknown function [Oenococcus oeni]